MEFAKKNGKGLLLCLGVGNSGMVRRKDISGCGRSRDCYYGGNDNYHVYKG